MSEKIMLTGIKPTGYPHLGNYIGAIKPALQMSKNNEGKALYFIADYHALNAVHDSEKFSSYTKEVAATWLSLGLGEDVIFYRQTEVPEILELAWILACLTPKGLMNRAHAYKAKVEHYYFKLPMYQLVKTKFSILKSHVILRRILIIHLARHLHFRSMSYKKKELFYLVLMEGK